jgi:hypothetical protein
MTAVGNAAVVVAAAYRPPLACDHDERGQANPRGAFRLIRPGLMSNGNRCRLCVSCHLVHARPFVVGIPRVVFARIAPSRIGHGSLRCFIAAVSVVCEDALAVAARG